MTRRVVFMADVTGSRQMEGAALAHDLKRLLSAVHHEARSSLLSPLTTTLGDEFQGLVHTLKAGIHLLFVIESLLRRDAYPFRLRYVICRGDIETPINREIAYGMLGPALTKARDLLGTKSRDRCQFVVALDEPILTQRLNRVLQLLESLSSQWNANDYRLIQAMIEEPGDAILAQQFDRDRTAIYRRRQTLRIGDYLLLRALAYDLATEPLDGSTLVALRKEFSQTQRDAAAALDMKRGDWARLEREELPIDHELQRHIDLHFGFDLSQSLW